MASVLAEVVVLASLSGRFDSNLEFKKTASTLADKEVLRSYYESRIKSKARGMSPQQRSSINLRCCP